MNQKNKWTIKTLLEVALILFVVGMAWATVRERVQINNANIQTNCIAIKENKDDIGSIKEDMREIRTLQITIKDDIKEIKKKM